MISFKIAFIHGRITRWSSPLLFVLLLLGLMSGTSSKDTSSSTKSAVDHNELSSILTVRAILVQAREFEDQGKNTKALNQYDVALAFIQKFQGDDDIANAAYVHGKIGELRLFLNEYEAALLAFAESHRMYKSVPATTNSNLVKFIQQFARMLFYYGLVYWRQEDDEGVVRIWEEECLTVYQSIFMESAMLDETELARVALIHFHLHDLYLKHSGYQKSTYHFQKSLEMLEQIMEHFGSDAFYDSLPPRDQWSYRETEIARADLMSIAEADEVENIKKMTTDEMLQFITLELDISELIADYEGQNINNASLYFVAATLYYETGDMENAEVYFQTSLRIFDSAGDTESEMAMCFWYLCGVYLQTGRFIKASTAYKLTIELLKFKKKLDSDTSTRATKDRYLESSSIKQNDGDDSNIKLNVFEYLRQLIKQNTTNTMKLVKIR